MAKTITPPDPLADLREPDTTTGVTSSPEPEPPVCTHCGNDLAAEGQRWCLQCLEDAPSDVRDAVWHQDATAAIVTRWHNDETTTTYLHHGGSCGCYYLARQSVLAVHGAPVEPLLPDLGPED